MRSSSAIGVSVVGTTLVLACALVALAVGVFPTPLRAVVEALRDLFLGRPAASAAASVIADVRLPRVVAAIAVGAALGASGCALQALLRNPLASPFVVGTSQASAFGAVLAIALGLPLAAQIASAFAFAVLATLLVLALSRTSRSLPTESVVLTGLAVSLLFGALVGLVRFLAHDEGVIGRIAVWLLGGLYPVTWSVLAPTAPLVVAAVVATCLLWRPLDLLALGAPDAERLGVRPARVGAAVLLLVSVMTSLAVSIGGVVAFVGLIVPHAARRMVGPRHSALLPASAFLGAVLVIAADTLARSAAPPQELPLGVLTSLIGVPAFLVILRSLRIRPRAA